MKMKAVAKPKKKPQAKKKLPVDPQILIGQTVTGNWGGHGDCFTGQITSANDNGTVNITYDDGDYETHVEDFRWRKRQGGVTTATTATTMTATTIAERTKTTTGTGGEMEDGGGFGESSSSDDSDGFETVQLGKGPVRPPKRITKKTKSPIGVPMVARGTVSTTTTTTTTATSKPTSKPITASTPTTTMTSNPTTASNPTVGGGTAIPKKISTGKGGTAATDASTKVDHFEKWKAEKIAKDAETAKVAASEIKKKKKELELEENLRFKLEEQKEM